LALICCLCDGTLAHSGSEQEQQACTRDVQRFCRKLMDQGDFTFWPASRKIVQSFLPPAARCWSATGNSERKTAASTPSIAAIIQPSCQPTQKLQRGSPHLCRFTTALRHRHQEIAAPRHRDADRGVLRAVRHL